MDSAGGVFQNRVKDPVNVVYTLLLLSLQESSQGRQIPINSCRTFTIETVNINGIQDTTFNSRHLFRQYTQFLHPPGWGPTLHSGVGNHPDVPQLLDGCLSSTSRAACSHQVYIQSLHLHGGVLRAGWPWTLSGNSGCPEFLSSQGLSRTTSVQVFTPSWARSVSLLDLLFSGDYFPMHTHRNLQVLLTQANTEEVFRMLYSSALPQFIQLLKSRRTSKMKWHRLLFEETLLILVPFQEVEHVLRWNL